MQRIQFVGLLLVSAISASSQTLSPRELFYGQGRAPAKPAGTASRARPAPVKKPSTAVDVPASPSLPEASEISESKPVAVPVQLASATTGPLGLKYTILKRGESGDYVPVDSDSTFVNGDHIKLAVEVNDPAYLYVVAQGTSGVWKVLYPAPGVNGGDNRVQPGRQYAIPNDSVFTFYAQPGKEKLFLVLSRLPEGDLEKLIYSLQDKSPDKQPKGALSRPLMAQNIGPVENDLIEHLRQTYSRDLLIEKVDDSKSAPPEDIKKLQGAPGAQIPMVEKAVYVVNRNAGPTARVVADVQLQHE